MGANFLLRTAAIMTVKVAGKTQAITNGDTTPSAEENTLFGNVSIVGATEAHDFEVANSGNTPLEFSVVTAGAGFSAQFVFSKKRAVFTIPAGQTKTLRVTFNPSTAGTQTAVVTLTSNALGLAQFTFAVQGTGLGACLRPFNPNIEFTGPGSEPTRILIFIRLKHGWLVCFFSL